MWTRIGSLSLFFLLSSILCAQEVQVLLSEENPVLGESLLLELRVSGASEIELPEMKNDSLFHYQYRGELRSISTNIVGGKRTQQQSIGYQWVLIPLKTGEWEVPPYTLMLDGTVYITDPLKITVSDPPEVEGFELELTADNPTAFAGQPVFGRLVLSFKTSVKDPVFIIPGIHRNDWNIQPVPPSPDQEDVRRVNIDGKEFYGSLTSAYRRGEQVSLFTLPIELTREEPGRFTLERAMVSFDYPRGEDIFGNPAYARTTLQSDPLEIEILELPGVVRESPLGIILARNKLEITMRTEPAVLNRGDPFECIMSIRGLAYPERMEWPDPLLALQWGDSFQTMNQESKESVLADGTVELRMRMRFTGAGEPRLPRFEIPYLSLESRNVEYTRTVLFNPRLSAETSGKSGEPEVLGSVDTDFFTDQPKESLLKPASFLPVDRLGQRRRLPSFRITILLLFLFPFTVFLYRGAQSWHKKVQKKSTSENYPWEEEGVEPLSAWDQWLEEQSEAVRGRLHGRRDEWEKAIYGSSDTLGNVIHNMSRCAEKEGVDE